MTCEQARTICHKNQYREASLRERLRLWTHLITCKTCSRFSRKNSKLTDLCDEAALHYLSDEEKHLLRDRIERERGQGPAN